MHKEADEKALRKEKETLLLKQEANENDIAERMKDFEGNTSVAGKADNIMRELRAQIKDEDLNGKDTKFRVNKVTEWLENETRERTRRIEGWGTQKAKTPFWISRSQASRGQLGHLLFPRFACQYSMGTPVSGRTGTECSKH